MGQTLEGVVLFGDEPLSIDKDSSDGFSYAIVGEYPNQSIESHGVTFTPGPSHILFLNSRYGVNTQEITRYSSYLEQTEAWQDGETTRATQSWRDWLGPDIYGDLHEPHTARIAAFLIERSIDMPEGNQALLMITTFVHDKGESVVGDIQYTQKTAEHEAEEARVLSTLLAEIYPFCSEQMLADIGEVIWPTEKGEYEELAMVFNAVERIGYLDTALRAWRASLDPCKSAHDRSVLRSMAHEVSSRHYPILRQREAQIPAIAEYTNRVGPTWEEIHKRD